MAPKQKLIVAFDLYGTLLSTSSIASDLAKHFGKEKADQIATKWRQYQLEYTWRLTALALPYIPFDRLTRAALIHAVNEAGIHIADAKADALMDDYNGLDTFADVLDGLKTLQASETELEAVIFSNGTPKMLESSMCTSPTLKLFDGPALFKKLISVDAVQKYKPQPEVYEHLRRAAVGEQGGPADKAAVWLVTANPFDVVGARSVGIRAAWVDREGTGWVDRLGDLAGEFGGVKRDLKPTIVVSGVDEAVKKILEIGI